MEIQFDTKSQSYIIDGIGINEILFTEELIEYRIEHREDLIDNLIDWISETERQSDKVLMKEDLKLLLSVNDEYILSSISTNDYIIKSIDEERFNQECKTILEKNKEV